MTANHNELMDSPSNDLKTMTGQTDMRSAKNTPWKRSAVFAVLILVALLVWWQKPPRLSFSRPSAAALVQHARQGEEWVHQIDGLRIRFEGKWSRSPESIAVNKKEIQMKLPGAELTPERFEELRPEQTESLEIVFDRHRFTLISRREGGWGREAAWDGYRAVERFANPSRHAYSIEPRPYRLGRSLFADLSWLRTQPHDFAWISPEFEDLPAAERPDQKALREQWQQAEYELVGRESYRGLDCWRLARKGPNFECWLIGVDTGRLHAILTGELPDPEEDLRVGAAVLAKWGQSIKSEAEAEAWLARRDAATQRQVNEEFDRLHRATIRPSLEHWMLDYQELAPGRWLPMTQGYRFWGGNATNAWIQVQREFKAVEVRLESDLSAESFQIEIPEGGQVTDHTHEPWLLYKQRKDRPPEEWPAIIDAAKDREASKDHRQSAIDALVGKPAPPFPRDARWLNNEPLTWED